MRVSFLGFIFALVCILLFWWCWLIFTTRFSFFSFSLMYLLPFVTAIPKAVNFVQAFTPSFLTPSLLYLWFIFAYLYCLCSVYIPILIRPSPTPHRCKAAFIELCMTHLLTVCMILIKFHTHTLLRITVYTCVGHGRGIEDENTEWVGKRFLEDAKIACICVWIQIMYKVLPYAEL